ncbi:MAG: DEAD/DEAH box helicase [Bowdeniella nasicola]|nr:DEAD/DEAH box helicase [Bowdeniella nasicola]
MAKRRRHRTPTRPAQDTHEELSPAERYAAAMERSAEARTALAHYAEGLDFELDDYQREACRAVERGQGVLVAAPTGAGKTVVGEFAAHLALDRGVRLMYTTPIKALSNQKYREFSRAFGSENVGILTGDVSINAGAPVVVMTTEVLRNMLYQDAQDLADVRFVVMDEVHYLADRFRGPVWEECMILLPERVQVISLSATVSNAEEFGAWLSELRGHTEIVVSEHRPVPLTQHILIGSRLLPLSHPSDPTRVNRQVYEAIGRPGRRRRRTRIDRGRVVETLERADLLPAIVFVFSRAGCQGAVDEHLAAGTSLTTAAQRRRIDEVIEGVCASLSAADRAAVGFENFRQAALAGIAAHHAGILPVFKECVETLFSAGLLKVCYATETLALGINMPARSVVIESLVKWDGSEHVMLTPGQFTQLTGRAGRRGIDVHGHAIVCYDPRFDVDAVAQLASKRTYPLNSAFRPTYSMAVNLLSWLSRDQAERILESSFAQFQADRSVGGLARRIRKERVALEGYLEALTCECGDVAEYLRLRAELSTLEKETQARRRAAAEAAVFQSLSPGDVIDYRFGRRLHRGVIVQVRDVVAGGRAFTLVDGRAVVRTMTEVDFPSPPSLVGHLEAGERALRNAKVRHRLVNQAKRMRGARRRPRAERDPQAAAEIARLRAAIRAHPSHHCVERSRHERWAGRITALQRSLAGKERALAEKTDGLAFAFRKICTHLRERGYLNRDDTLTPAGEMLRHINAEADLQIAEAIRAGIFTDLEARELAGAATLMVYAARGESLGRAPRPRGRLGTASDRLHALNESIREDEARLGIPEQRALDGGLVAAMRTWASGGSLRATLEAAEIPPGDLVRWTKQCSDVLDQIRDAANRASYETLAARAREARTLIDRDIVRWSSVL